jgi:hypothetical protein
MYDTVHAASVRKMRRTRVDGGAWPVAMARITARTDHRTTWPRITKGTISEKYRASSTCFAIA